jgi:hypothetical protein
MRYRLLIIPILALLLLPAFSQIPLVDEARTEARLGPEAVDVFFAMPADTGRAELNAVILDTRDKEITRGSGKVDIQNGRAHLHFVVPKEKSSEQLMWARVRYEAVAGERTQRGVITLGAICSELFELRASTTQTFRPGSPLTVYLRASNAVTKAAVPGVRVRAELNESESGKTGIIRIGTIRADGSLKLVFPTAKGVAAYDLEIAGTRGHGPEQTVSLEIESSDPLTGSVQTDKPLYQPGQTVHMRAAMARVDGAAPRVDLQWKIRNTEEYNDVFNAEASTNKWGIANLDWQVPENLPLGTYWIEVSTGDNGRQIAGAAFKLSRYDLPQFRIDLKADQPFYLPGQAATIKVSANYLFGKPVKNAKLRLVEETKYEWNREKHKYEIEEGEVFELPLDENGKASIHPSIGKYFKGADDEFRYSNFRDVRYAAYVTDPTTNRTEQRRFNLRLSKEAVHVYVDRIGKVGSLQRLFITTFYPDGKPCACDVRFARIVEKHVGDRSTRTAPEVLKEFRTNSYGLAKITVTAREEEPASRYQSTDVYWRLDAVDTRGNRGSHEQEDYMWYDRDTTAFLDTDRTLIPDGEPIVGTVTVEKSLPLVVSVLDQRFSALASITVSPRNKKAHFVFPYQSNFRGELRVIAYSLADDRDTYGSYIEPVTRSVLYPKHDAVSVSIRGLRSTYRPGDTVSGVITARDDSGPLNAAYGIAVTDRAVDERMKTDVDFVRSMRWDYSYADRDGFAGISRADLQALDLRHGVPKDLDLLAEMVLSHSYVDLAFDSSMGSSQDQYLDLIRSRGRALSQTLEDHVRRTRDFPMTLEGLMKAFGSARAQAAISDPWDVPMRFSVALERDRYLVSSVSAGPDKRFGTVDDIEDSVTNLSVFTPYAPLVEEVVRNSMTVAGPTLHTSGDLNAALKKAGIGLDSFTDPEGLHFEVSLQPMASSLVLFACVRTKYGCQNTWTHNFGYFLLPQKAIADALRTSGRFPTSQAQWDDFVKANNIPFAEMRDGWGNPVAVKFGSKEIYTDRQSIRVGGHEDRKIVPVSHKVALITIVSGGNDGVIGNDNDVRLAEFLAPITEQSGKDAVSRSAKGGAVAENAGSLSGVVMDATGAVIPDTLVRILGPRGESIETRTDEEGRFEFALLPPGLYELAAEKQGFKVADIDYIQVTALSQTDVEIEMHPGATAETVEVTASAVSVDTTSTALSVSLPKKQATGLEPQEKPMFTPRLRNNFVETTYWNPFLVPDRFGNARFSFQVADTLTDWKVSVFGSTMDARTATAERSFQTFQPFFLDQDPPKVLTIGDTIHLPVVLRNYTGSPMHMKADMSPAPWMKIVGDSSLDVAVPANDSASPVFSFTARTSANDAKQRVTARNASAGDAVEKQLKVHPFGEERWEVQNELLMGPSLRSNLHLSPDALADSRHVELTVYPSLGSHLHTAIEGILERPYGCAEQTISSTYPSLLLLDYSTKASVSPARVAQAKKYLKEGYDRLRGYFSPDGGLTYWGKGHADETLTAYGLEFLLDAEKWMPVDDELVTSTKDWLLAQVRAATTVKADQHSSPEFKLARDRELLYLGSALAKYAAVKNQVQERSAAIAVAKQLEARYASSPDPYEVAALLRLQQMVLLKSESSVSAERLRKMVKPSTSGNHWNLSSNTFFYGWGRAGDVETTAIATSALVRQACGAEAVCKAATDDEIIRNALLYVIRAEDQYHSWYSGHTTVEVLRLLMQFAAPAKTQPVVQLTVNQKPVRLLNAAIVSADSPLTFDISSAIQPGDNDVTIQSTSEFPLMSYHAVSHFYVPWADATISERTTTGPDYGLDYSTKCDHPEAKISQVVKCTANVKRFGLRSYGMLVAEVGIPPGTEIDREYLDREMERSGIQRYEVQPDGIVFYVWGSEAKGVSFTFLFKPRYGIDALAAPSALWDYYNPDLRVVLPPQRFKVSE